MRTVLAISPHLDDAVFSAGGLLWSAAQRGWRVVVATVFTGNVEQPRGFALACQLDKGLPPSIDYMALRREEDRQACAAIGAEAVHLPLLEAPHRGYESAAALFDRALPKDKAGAEVSAALADLLTAFEPDLVLGPMAIGGHVDHLIVRASAESVLAGTRLRLWEDWPYVDRANVQLRSSACRRLLSPEARAVKYRACACYASQLGFQFGGAAALGERLQAQTGEWFHHAPSG